MVSWLGLDPCVLVGPCSSLMSMHTYTTLPLYFARLSEGKEQSLKVGKNKVKERTYKVEKKKLGLILLPQY